MNLKSLPTHVMLTLTQVWLSDSRVRDKISAHPLGKAAYDNLRDNGAELARLHRLRNDIARELARLGQLLQGHDADYDRFVRAIHQHLSALIEAASTAELASEYRELRDFLFPHGVSIVQRSYMEESGVAVEIDESISAEQIARLGTIRVGEHTLADLYHGWIKAGRALGEGERERAQLQASIARQGTAATQTSSQDMRHKWIRAVRLVFGTMDAISLPEEIREKFMAPLLKCMADAQRRSDSPRDDDDDDGDDDILDSDPVVDDDIEAGSDVEIAALESSRDATLDAGEAEAAPAVAPAETSAVEVTVAPAEAGIPARDSAGAPAVSETVSES